MKKKIGIVLCIFHEIRFFRKILGKILHSSIQVFSQLNTISKFIFLYLSE